MRLSPTAKPTSTEIAPDIRLDSRRALIHVKEGWMAVADLHYGYELRRQLHGDLLPDWGMDICEQTLVSLIHDHRPKRLILVGDIMDGKSSAEETHAFLERIQEEVPELISIQGNHDRPPLRKSWNLVETHHEGEFTFTHGHRWTQEQTSDVDVYTHSAAGTTITHSKTIHITGHEHPAVHLKDGAGLKLKLAALVQEQITPRQQRWILPAFSPWAMGGEYTSSHTRLATWLCAPTRVWRLP